jgi:hypothetical protein
VGKGGYLGHEEKLSDLYMTLLFGIEIKVVMIHTLGQLRVEIYNIEEGVGHY